MSEELSWRKHLSQKDTTATNVPNSIYTCALSAGVSGGIIVSGLISIHYHWRYIYWVSIALIGTCTLLVVLTFPETMYRRDEASLAADGQLNVNTASFSVDTKGVSEHNDAVDSEKNASHAPEVKRRGFIQNLRLFSGSYTSEPFWKLFVRPVILLSLPPVLWATLVMSGTIGFLVAITSNFAPAFAAAYNFQPWQSGLCFIAALIGSFIGIFMGGRMGDYIADKQTQKNGGIREPEMRLPAILISCITAPLALILYGVGIQDKLHWICPTIGLALSMSSTIASFSQFC